MRTQEEIQNEIDRWVGKRNQHLEHSQGHPMLALDCQDRIDSLINEMRDIIEIKHIKEILK